MKYIGLLLLAIWLIAQGAGSLLNIYFPYEAKVLPIINVISGVLLTLTTIKLKHGDIGIFFLGCWAILQSSLFLFHITFSHSNLVVHLLGILAGILLILKI